MRINDIRNKQVGVKWESLINAEVYVDTNGRYVMKTDEDAVVDLADGGLYCEIHYQLDYDTFTPVKAQLKIE